MRTVVGSSAATHRWLISLLACAGLASCGVADSDLTPAPESPTSPAVASPTSTSPAEAAATEATATTASSTESDGQDGADHGGLDDVGLCGGLEAVSSGTVEVAELVEASGVAASSRSPGVVWAHNDSGRSAALYAIGPAGENVTTVALPDVDGFDIEDMAIVDGMVYLADIGDNDRRRDQVVVFRFPEPDPTQPELAQAVERFVLQYPDGPRDAEAFLVDPRSGDLIVVEKSFRPGRGDGSGLLAPSPAGVYVASPPFGDDPIQLTLAGTVPLDNLAGLATASAPDDAIVSQLGVSGVATGADSNPDGSVVAIRTYDTVWLFPRPDGPLVGAFAAAPCEAAAPTEPQGEAVAFLPTDDGTVALVTVSEGRNPTVHRITAERP